MSASLVGSEMCIRDRVWSQRFRTSDTRCHASLFLIWRSDCAIVRRKVAVSYTHLTLPTICSV
eukprot:12905391-Alexandrium_andersonii.AAC.1